MPTVNDAAPDFTLYHTNSEKITLSDYRGKKVVLAFFPAAFTGVCQKELCTFQDQLAELNDLNATVLGISVDGPFANGAFASQNGINFPILSDHERKATHAYDVALPDFAGTVGYTASKRVVFIVDEAGTITYRWEGPHPGVEPDYDAIREALG